MDTQRSSLSTVKNWPVSTAAAAWRTSQGETEHTGPVDHIFELASVTKLLVSYATLISIEEGTLDLDQPLGPEGATLCHLLSHSSGMGFEGEKPISGVAQRRMYSNAGFEMIGQALAAASDMSLSTYFTEAVAEPLGMTQTDLYGSAGFGARSCVSDLLKFVAELLNPTLISAETFQLATRPHFEHLAGVLPGFGHQDPNLWGLGFEIRGTKSPHWSAPTNSESTFGHFGRAGTLLWVDPTHKVGCVALTDRAFGPWAKEAWPALSTTILTKVSMT